MLFYAIRIGLTQLPRELEVIVELDGLLPLKVVIEPLELDDQDGGQLLHTQPLHRVHLGVSKLMMYRYCTAIEEGRAASKSPHETFGYFLSSSQQEFSAGIIQNSAVRNFSPKTDVFSFPVHFKFFAIFSYCLHFATFVCL